MKMRTIRFIKSVRSIVVFAIGLAMAVGAVVVLGSLSAQAEAPKPELKAVHPNYLLPGINQACPKGSQKVFRVEFSVPKRTKITRAREFMLVLKSGDVLSAEPERVNKRLVEYHLFPRSRKAQVNLYDMRFNLASAAYTAYDYTMVLSKDCIIKEY